MLHMILQWSTVILAHKQQVAKRFTWMYSTFETTEHAAPESGRVFFKRYSYILLRFWILAITYLMHCGCRLGLIVLSTSGLYSGLIYSFKWLAMKPHRENVRSDSFKSRRSFSQLPTNVPNWHECTWSCRISRKRSLNSKASLRWLISCQVQSRNCVKIGETSRGSVCTWPQRSLNLCPNASQSFSIRAFKIYMIKNKPNRGIFLKFNTYLKSLNSSVIRIQHQRS